MLSYTSVQQIPPAYRGKHTLQSTEPATADHPKRAPQLKARPMEHVRKLVPHEDRNDPPRTACGQCVTRFINGYMVTTERDEAPRRMLDRITLGKANLTFTSDTPVPIQLCQDNKPGGQLDAQESERLGGGYVSFCEWSILRSCFPAAALENASQWDLESRTNSLIKSSVPHVVDGATSAPHDECTYPKQTEIGQRCREGCL